MRKPFVNDPNFCPVQCKANDELFPNGIFVWNITLMSEWISQNLSEVNFETIHLDRIPFYPGGLNEEHVPSVNLARPIILAEVRPGSFSLIDGHHRYEKTRRLGIKELPAYTLTSRQHIPFLVRKDGYDAYVDYWNEKLKSDFRIVT